MVSRSNQQNFALAIDIGGTKAAFCLINTLGELLIPAENRPIPFNTNGVAIPEKIIELISEYVNHAKQIDGNLVGIGLSCCGNIDTKTGMAVLVPNLHWKNVPIGQMVADSFSLPVFSATDVRMAALAESVWGRAVGVQNFAWATVGTGYGGYLFLNGSLFEGAHGFAGNFGHTTLDEMKGFPCGCGKRGCFETFVAGPAIARAGQEVAENGKSPYLQQILISRKITTRDVVEGEKAGDPSSKEIMDQVIRLISINLGGLVNTLDLDMIILGGGVVHSAPDFIDRIRYQIPEYLMTEEAKRDLRIEKETYPNSALIGAAVDVFIHQGMISTSQK